MLFKYDLLRDDHIKRVNEFLEYIMFCCDFSVRFVLPDIQKFGDIFFLY